MARLTPATTAMSPGTPPPPAEPPTPRAGRPPTPPPSRWPRPARLHPSLLTGSSAPRSPVISATASTSASASRACDTTIPCNALLIVLGQVLAQLALFRHPLEQSGVERLGGVHPAVAQQMVHRDHFGNDRDVLPRVERHRDERELHAQNTGGLPIQPRPLRLTGLLPIGEFHHDFDALLLAHRMNAEQPRDVHQSHAPDLHVPVGKLVRPADEGVRTAVRDVH